MRRLFWVSLGAALGVSGYRRATVLARSLRPQPQPAGRGGGAGASKGLTGFAADVREGMALYMERQAGRAPSTLEGQTRGGLGPAAPGERLPGNPRPKTRSRKDEPKTRSRNNEPKDGR